MLNGKNKWVLNSTNFTTRTDKQHDPGDGKFIG